jgi:hypothetical protein
VVAGTGADAFAAAMTAAAAEMAAATEAPTGNAETRVFETEGTSAGVGSALRLEGVTWAAGISARTGLGIFSLGCLRRTCSK